MNLDEMIRERLAPGAEFFPETEIEWLDVRQSTLHDMLTHAVANNLYAELRYTTPTGHVQTCRVDNLSGDGEWATVTKVDVELFGYPAKSPDDVPTFVYVLAEQVLVRTRRIVSARLGRRVE